MRNLAAAYAKRDSVEYKSLFDSLYTGTSLDQSDQSAQLLTYTKADEAQHIAGLARSTSVTSVELELVPNLVVDTDAGDPPGWRRIQNPFTRLIVFDAPDSWEVRVLDEYIEYKFIPKPPDSSSTDTTWKIIRWTEVHR